MDLKSTYTVFKFCLKWKEIFISLKFNKIGIRLIKTKIEAESMITMVGNYVEYDCRNLVTTDELKKLAIWKLNKITNDAVSIRKIHPQRNEILEVLKEYKSPLYKLKMRELIGFEAREEKFNDSSFLKSFNFT
jgi:hypothetical protein